MPILPPQFTPSNSTTTLQNVVDYARTFAEVTPILPVAGYSSSLACTIGNDVMAAMLSRAFNWKWNRQNVPVFYTISWQQDYASLSPTNLKWIEHAWIIDINNSQIPKPIWRLEAVRDLEKTSYQYGRPGQVCWLPNDQLLYGAWGVAAGNASGTNPGPGAVYTQPLGSPQTPSNPLTQIIDTNGNLQVLTTFGTCGNSQPTWPSSGSPPGTNTNDGTCVWTVVDPKGQGFRLNPVPPQSGVVYQVNVVGQMKPPMFTLLSQFINPVPDDFAPYFRQGFVAHCYAHSPEMKVQAKFKTEYAMWMDSLRMSTEDADRERDAYGFYPDRSIMDQNYGVNWGPAWPWGTW